MNVQKAGEHTDPSGAGVLPTRGGRHPTRFQVEQGFCQHEKRSSSETPGRTPIQVEQGSCRHEDETILLSLKWSRGSANTRGKVAVASAFWFLAYQIQQGNAMKVVLLSSRHDNAILCSSSYQGRPDGDNLS